MVLYVENCGSFTPHNFTADKSFLVYSDHLEAKAFFKWNQK